MKQIAMAQAAGVLIDATIVRALLVPALMRILGEANWWRPALKRFQDATASASNRTDRRQASERRS